MRILTNLLMVVLIAVAIFALIVLPWPALLAIVVLLALWMAFTRGGRQAWSVTKVGVATIPLSAFYRDRTDHTVIRFCFAKRDETIEAAAQRLRRLR